MNKGDSRTHERVRLFCRAAFIGDCAYPGTFGIGQQAVGAVGAALGYRQQFCTCLVQLNINNPMFIVVDNIDLDYVIQSIKYIVILHNAECCLM